MAVPYVLAERGNPGDNTAPKKFYAVAKSSGDIDIRELAKEIADISTVSSIDTLAVIEGFLQLIPKHLKDGKIVRLRDFGTFSISLSGDGAETAQDYNSSMIKANKIRFRPDSQLKKTLGEVTFKKVTT